MPSSQNFDECDYSYGVVSAQRPWQSQWSTAGTEGGPDLHLKAAKALGVTVPLQLLGRADEVVNETPHVAYQHKALIS